MGTGYPRAHLGADRRSLGRDVELRMVGFGLSDRLGESIRDDSEIQINRAHFVRNPVRSVVAEGLGGGAY